MWVGIPVGRSSRSVDEKPAGSRLRVVVGEIGYEELATVLDRSRAKLHALPGVVATGIGYGEERSGAGLVIQVFVRSDEDITSLRHIVDALVPDVPTELRVSGEVTATGSP
jgi:hypothetical protein